MTIAEIVELRKSGQIEQAYDAMRAVYATDKSNRAKTVMFWTALDMMKLHITSHDTDEARLIYMALLHLFDSMNDGNGKAAAALKRFAPVFNSEQRLRTDDERKALGEWGEEMAAEYLRSKGYRVLAHDWRSGHRDIDLVCADGAVIVFVEVKTRRNGSLGRPEDAIDNDKFRNLLHAIYHYLHSHAMTGRDYRFDVVAVVGTLGSVPEITHWQNVSMV